MNSFIRVLFFLCALFAVATASPKPSKTTSSSAPTPTPSQCNTGPIQCCQSVEPATSSVVTTLLALLGIVLEDLDVNVGLTCSPLSIIGIGGDTCDASPVCCENNTFNGIIAIGCSPININL
ncbi:hypothetical protein M0805_002587 [Coniferiporia weirii]|nr:hypothetical protein M0805_002587 [Coniferiporia weirii]